MGSTPQNLEHYEVGVDRLLNGATIGVRAFRQQVDDQMVTLFGLRRPDGPAEALGHYYVGTAGDASIDGVTVSFSHALTGERSRIGGVLLRDARSGPTARRRRMHVQLARFTPAVLPSAERDRIHDVMTSLETEVPQTATRVVVFYRVNNAFVKAEDAEEVRGLDGRFETAGEPVAAVHELHAVAVGDAGGGPQHVQRSHARRLHLQRDPRRPPPEAHPRRPHRPLLAPALGQVWAIRIFRQESVALDRLDGQLNSALDSAPTIAANYREHNDLGLVKRKSQWYTVCCICRRKIPS